MSIHCRALWQCFRSQWWKAEETSISCQNAPDCTKLSLKFQNLPGVIPRTPIPGEGAQRPLPRSALRASTRGLRPLDGPPDSFILPLKQTAG